MPIIIGFLLFFVLRCYKNITVGKMPPSKLVPLFMILFYILGSMMTLTDQIKELIFEIGSLSNVEGIKPILNKTDFKCNAASPYKFPSTSIGQRGILFDNVTYIYPNAIQPILKDVNLFIRGGEKIGIVGDIGSGKSTLLKLLLKLKKPTCGDIYVNGHPYKNIKIKDIRSFIGYVPQQPILFNRSVVDNIKYGNPHITNEHVESIINNLGLQEEFSQLEKGIHTKIGKNGTKISGGQRQLVWCIRVLLSNPEILILDEPTASLDTKTKKLMISLLDRLMQNRTVIMVTHDPDLVKYADRLIVVQKGSIINHQNVANR
jgi:ABC-type bacteriocin/lantibiotic exporter with double-glycine peptidase domain